MLHFFKYLLDNSTKLNCIICVEAFWIKQFVVIIKNCQNCTNGIITFHDWKDQDEEEREKNIFNYLQNFVICTESYSQYGFEK